ncbi:GNAT family N-acetyltransferase [Flavobacterium sp. PLA-1-15]|uniref:GNAT family N-acetyltransferase n=1 Tax=Flavobacterium sp. PLA-1-15 TaxID=3380533 RepID=UPI003B78350F
MDNYELKLNEDKKRFEIEVEGHIAFIEYILTNDNVMFLTHTEVPKALGGKGIGSSIVEQALNYIKEHNYTLAPLCPFVAKYLVKNPNWQTILAKGYNVSK